MADKKLKITLKRSIIGSKPNQRKTVEALGLRRINSSVIRPGTESVLGMINVVSHLVVVEDAE